MPDDIAFVPMSSQLWRMIAFSPIGSPLSVFSGPIKLGRWREDADGRDTSFLLFRDEHSLARGPLTHDANILDYHPLTALWLGACLRNGIMQYHA